MPITEEQFIERFVHFNMTAEDAMNEAIPTPDKPIPLASPAPAPGAPAAPALASPTNQPLPTAALPDIGASAMTTAATIIAKVDTLLATVTDRAEEVAAGVAERVARFMADTKSGYTETHDNGRTITDTAAEKHFRALAHKAGETYRTEQAKITDMVVAAYYREIAALESQFAAIATDDLFKSPIKVLSRVGLGSTERSTYQLQIADAGESEIKSHAGFAIATGNKVFGAAVLARIGALNSKSLDQTKTDLAEKLVGAEWKKLYRTIATARAKLQDAKDLRLDKFNGLASTLRLRAIDGDDAAAKRRAAVAKAINT